MRALAGLLRRLFGAKEEEVIREVPEEKRGSLGGAFPEGSGAGAPSLRGEAPRGAGGSEVPLGGEMPGGAAAGAAGFSGMEVRGTAEGTGSFSGGELPGRGGGFAVQEEVLPLGGPPEDGARALSELLRFQRRMGSTAGDFGGEVL